MNRQFATTALLVASFASSLAWQGCSNSGGASRKEDGGTTSDTGGTTGTSRSSGGTLGTGGNLGGTVGSGGVSSSGGSAGKTGTSGVNSTGGATMSLGGATSAGGVTGKDAASDSAVSGTGGGATRDGGRDAPSDAPSVVFDAPSLRDASASDAPFGDAVSGDAQGGDSLFAIGCPAVITNPVPADVLAKLPGSGPKFTGKYIDCYGLPIMNAKEVSDLAVLRDRDCVEAMLRKIAREPSLNSILATMIKNGCGAALTPVNGDICTIWTDTACGGTVRGGGGIISVVGEEDALCQAQPQWDTDFCVIIHEFTHTLHMYGIQPARPDLEKRIVAAYNAAITANLYTESSYDRDNEYEYIAGQVPRFFNCNPTDLSNQIGTMTDREALAAYDPAIYQLITELFDADVFPWTPPRAAVP